MAENKPRIVNAVPALMGKPVLRPYNIVDLDDDVEITMYGEVVQSVPTDWWTGEPIEGLFIVLSDFLKDIDALKQKNSITVRINSVGGDLDAGVAIYNRLKEMNNVTTIVDGLAASAASIILQAGAVRQVYSSSQVMVHGASIGLCDYYNAQALQGMLDMVKAADEQVVNVYAERTGESPTKLKHMVEATTWMTGQDAVDKGFADEVISGQVNMSMTADKKQFVCNGIPMNPRRLGVIPKGVDIIPSTKEVQNAIEASDIKNSKKEENLMTVEELRNEYPDLIQEIENAAREKVDLTSAENAARDAERARIKDIESIEASIADKALVAEAKYGEHPMDAKDLALAVMQKNASLGNQFLKNLNEDTAVSNTDKVTADANSGNPAEDGSQTEAENAASMAKVLAAVNKMNGGK